MHIWNTNFCPLCPLFIFRPSQTPKNQNSYPDHGERGDGLISSSGIWSTNIKFHKICPMIASLSTRNLQEEITPFRVRCYIRSSSIFVSFSLDSYSHWVLSALLKQYSTMSHYSHVGVYYKPKLPYKFLDLE